MAAARPRVFHIPPSAPFLPTLIAALLDGRLVPGFPAGDDPLALASATIYLPTRRACRLARDLFLDMLGGEAALLPRLAPIGDIDDDELIFAEAAGTLGPEALALPEALGPLERRLLLAQLVLTWARSADLRGTRDAPLVANSPAAALALADALARLIDDMITRGVPWSKLDGLVPDHVDVYWQLTLQFLKVAHQHWPAVLAAHGAIEAAERRDRLIAAEAARLKAADTGPVIAAGSTGSMPATAALLTTIAQLPRGAVVLPGLDTHLDEPSWRMIAGAPVADGREALNPTVGHPQFAMQALLSGLGLTREDVASLVAAAPSARDRLISEALRPAAASELWSGTLAGENATEALRNVAVIEAANAEEEALAIAVALREAVETRGKTAALVTPDRGLARRVIAALDRWRVEVDDSGGEALADTPAGVFARLAAEAALIGLEPVTLLALLKHPLFHAGAAGNAHALAVSSLERAVLRGPRPQPKTDGLADALVALRANRGGLHPADPRARLREWELDAASRLVERLHASLRPLEELGSAPRPLAELAARHRDALLALAGEDEPAFAESAQAGGSAVLEMLDEIAESAGARTLVIDAADYPDLLTAAMAGRVVRREPNPQARVRIFGLLEARLQHPDLIVLGGLVEGVWPPQTRTDPWLSRPMRLALGLDLPERRIGLTAHDFAQALGGPEAILSRAAKVGGAPTVPSRFVQRLTAVAGKEPWANACACGERYLAWARSLDHPTQVTPARPPAPTPPLAARPARLSITEIEHWLRDPYTIYAKHILRLAPLDPVDTPPGARDRGSVIHAAIEEFATAYASGLPADPLAELIRIGEAKFAPLLAFPESRAFWWPRFERIARWLIDWETKRRADIEAVLAEIPGEVEIPTPTRVFKLSGRADRIERLGDGVYALLDFKTGQVATARQVRQGLAPQLTLGAAMLQQGGFAGVPAGGHVEAISYVQIRGGEPAGDERVITWNDANAHDEAIRAFDRLRARVLLFEDEATPYAALAHPMWSGRYGDYDHLARVKEWTQIGDEDDFGGPP